MAGIYCLEYNFFHYLGLNLDYQMQRWIEFALQSQIGIEDVL